MVEQGVSAELSEDILKVTSGRGSSFGVLFGRIDGGQIDANGISKVLLGALDQRGNPLVREHRVFLTYESIEEALNSCGESPSQGFKKVWNFLQAKIERVSESFLETEKPRLIFYMSNVIQPEAIAPLNIADNLPPSLLSFFKRGLLTRQELRQRCPDLSFFLKEKGLRIRKNLFSKIYDYFRVTEGVFRKEEMPERPWHTYLIDPEIMEGFLPELKDFVLQIKQAEHPPRTEAEKQFYKAQILSKPDSDGSYNMISLEQAIDWCSNKATSYLQFKEFIEEKEDLAQEALIRALPHLQGERGNFPDFQAFQHFFNKILKNLVKDMYRLKNGLKEESLDLRQEWDRGFLIDDRPTKENTGNTISEELVKAIVQRLGGLDLRNQQILDLRLQQELPYSIIARICGEDEGVLRVRVYRILDSLHPQREKKNVSQWKRKSDAEMRLSYREFRKSFLTEKGKLPGGADVDRAHKNGLIICRAPTYALRFAGCYSWIAARGILEQEISREQEAEVI